MPPMTFTRAIGSRKERHSGFYLLRNTGLACRASYTISLRYQNKANGVLMSFRLIERLATLLCTTLQSTRSRQIDGRRVLTDNHTGQSLGHTRVRR
ncbi:hypothetical protein EVAR_54862_1 [Eumeta japonica]|uniref:Uncharacterized protein n=1 Tax=Eumeta variegata TaxID=151549 RepID=A0A4C1YFJ5_EUMVA|nr:hypothetical protein EVAR_54862_1 [Eumeta japonica]